jgi:hypothetical protein
MHRQAFDGSRRLTHAGWFGFTDQALEVLRATSEVTDLSHFKYILERGHAWIALESTNEYQEHACGAAVVDRIVQEIRHKSIQSLVSLGPGSGKTEVRLLRALQKANCLPKYYHPCDISPALLDTARQTVRSASFTCSEPILVDIEHALVDAKGLFDTFKRPRVFVSIGNTVGNFESPNEFFQSARTCMTRNDYLLLHVSGIGNSYSIDNDRLIELFADDRNDAFVSAFRNFIVAPFLKRNSPNRLDNIRREWSRITLRRELDALGAKLTFRQVDVANDPPILVVRRFDEGSLRKTLEDYGFMVLTRDNANDTLFSESGIGHIVLLAKRAP